MLLILASIDSPRANEFIHFEENFKTNYFLFYVLRFAFRFILLSGGR